MAYSAIDKAASHQNSVTYTGTGSSNAVTNVGFKPDWSWFKSTGATYYHGLFDSVRGVDLRLSTNIRDGESSKPSALTSFDNDGFTLGSDTSNTTNTNSQGFVAWNWLAGGATPSQTYVVKVVSDSGNKYRFDDFGTSAVTLDLQEGGTYTFDQSDSSNAGHPLRFYTASDKTGGEYTTGVTTNGTPGSSGAYTRITVAASAPTLYYQCSVHAAMGGQANTNSTHGSSNFSGSIQTKVSANTTAGFSIVSWTGTGSNATIGHGLSAAPKVVILKGRSNTDDWLFYHEDLNESKTLWLNTNGFPKSASTYSSIFWNSTSPTSSVVSLGNNAACNGSSQTYIAYCFTEIIGYSKFGTYIGNGSADGPFVFTGFRPQFTILKTTSGTQNHFSMRDYARTPTNEDGTALYANLTNANDTGGGAIGVDFLSNGFKLRKTDSQINQNGSNYMFFSFGQPMVGSNDIPSTAR